MKNCSVYVLTIFGIFVLLLFSANKGREEDNFFLVSTFCVHKSEGRKTIFFWLALFVCIKVKGGGQFFFLMFCTFLCIKVK